MSRPAPSAARPWPQVLLLYACGLYAAVQLGKFSALAPLISLALGLSLPAMGLAISLVEAGGATLGGLAGRLAERLGLPRTLLAGMVALVAAGAAEAWAPDAGWLVAGRLLEAAGYLGVIVSAPVLIVRGTAPAGFRAQSLALTLWSTFVPVGLALGAWGSGGLAGPLGWRGAVAAWALAGLPLAAMLAWRARRWAAADRRAGLRDDGAGSGAPVVTTATATATTDTTTTAVTNAANAATVGPAAAGVRRLALTFGAFAIVEVGMLGLLPTLLVREAGLDAGTAGRWTALASLSAVAGSVVAALLLRHGRGLRVPCLLSLGLPPLLLFGVFRSQPSPPVALALAVAANMLGGIFASLAFALLPRVAGGSRALVRANGWIAQCGASGSLLGPPLMASAAQAAGWPAAAWLATGVSVLALPLVWTVTAPAVTAPRAMPVEHGQP